VIYGATNMPPVRIEYELDAIPYQTALGAENGMPKCDANGLISTNVLRISSDDVDTLVAGVSVAEALRRIGAITSGVVSDAGTGTETFQDYEGSVNTIVITVDSSGNRTNITYN